MPFDIPNTVDIPEGSYTATLERVEEAEGNFGKYRKWHFLIDVNGKLESLSSLTSANTGPKSKSYIWLTALMGGVAPQAGQTIEDPTGSRVIVRIAKNDKGFSNVVELLPFVEPAQVVPGLPR